MVALSRWRPRAGYGTLEEMLTVGGTEMIDRQRLMQTLLQYIDIQSASYHEAPCAAQIVQDLRALTYLNPQIEVDDVGAQCGSDTGNIYCKIQGIWMRNRCCSVRTWIPSTMAGQRSRPSYREKKCKSGSDTILSADDKSGIAAILEALRVIDEQKLPHRPIEVLFTVCEEVGLFGSKYADMRRFVSKCAIVPDSLGHAGNLIVRAPGQNRIYADIYGVAAHAGSARKRGRHCSGRRGDQPLPLPWHRRGDDGQHRHVLRRWCDLNIVSPKGAAGDGSAQPQLAKLEQYTARMVACLEQAAQQYWSKGGRSAWSQYACAVACAGRRKMRTCRWPSGEPRLRIASGAVELWGGSDSNNFNPYGARFKHWQRHACTAHDRMRRSTLWSLKGARMMLHLMRAAQ